MSPYVKLSNIQIHPSYLFGPITIFGPCVFNPKLILRFRDLKRFDRFLSGFVYFRVLLRTIYNIWFLFLDELMAKQPEIKYFINITGWLFPGLISVLLENIVIGSI